MKSTAVLRFERTSHNELGTASRIGQKHVVGCTFNTASRAGKRALPKQAQPRKWTHWLSANTPG